jgi:hypothetical protein
VVLVIDLEYAFTDSAFPMGGADLIDWPLPYKLRLREVTLASRWAQIDAASRRSRPRCSSRSGLRLPQDAARLAAGSGATVIVTRRMRSGCIRGTTVDSLSYRHGTLVLEDCVGDQDRDPYESKLREIHRRSAEVATANEAIAYLGRVEVLA